MRHTIDTVPQALRREPWNKGKLISAKPPLRPKHVWSIRTKLQIAERTRDLAMFNLAIDSPGIIGGGAAAKGVADMSLYRRLAALGLTGLRCFPQLVSVVPGSERIERYQQQILAALTPSEVERWRQAVTAAQADGTFFIAQAYHCAVATKPG